MVEFIVVAAAAFGLCWVWVGGYLADFFIWIISKLTPDTSDEKTLAYVVAGIFLAFGIVIAVIQSQQNGASIGGLVVGIGAYIAVRLPGKIRVKRENKAIKRASSQGREDRPAGDRAEPMQASAPLAPGQAEYTRDIGQCEKTREE
jgi:hypothetical protein